LFNHFPAKTHIAKLVAVEIVKFAAVPQPSPAVEHHALGKRYERVSMPDVPGISCLRLE
jgi:hypothetical protein